MPLREVARRLHPQLRRVQTRAAATLSVLIAASAMASIGSMALGQPLPLPRVVGGERQLTLDDIYGPHALDLEGTQPTIVGWMPDGKQYIVYDDNGSGDVQLLSVTTRTGQRAPLYDGARMQAALAQALAIPESAAHGLAYGDWTLNAARTEAVLSYHKDLYLVRFADCTVARLTASPLATKESIGFSPDGRRVAYVREGTELAVTDTTASAPGETVLTHPDPKAQDGRLDWVYGEEVFDRAGGHPGYVWSGDSRRLAFLRLDETPVHPYTISNDLPRVPEAEVQLYPLAGDPNPVATVGVVEADGLTSPRFVDLARYPAHDRLIVRLGWSPDSRRVVYEVQNRAQTILDLNAAYVGGESPRDKPTTLIHETTGAWVDITSEPVWLRDGGFLWLSDRSGHRQIYRYDADGQLAATLTDARTGDIRAIYGVDAANRWAYVSEGFTPGATGDAVCRLALKGKFPTEPAHLSLPGGGHEPLFDPTFHAYLDTHSDRATPTRVDLYDANTGAQLAQVAQNPGPLRAIAPFRRTVPETLTVPARDGVPLHALLIRPPDFDSQRHYPIYFPIYGGPGIPNVADRWGNEDDLFYQMLAEQGYVVFLCDNRSAGGSPADAWPIHRRFGENELRDLEDAVTYLKTLPWVDSARIGLSGWSFGGFLTEYALTHSRSFKIGISGAGVADWRFYDSVYTERYMDTPHANPDGYRAAAPVTAAADCAGRLLLLHGMMDDNVHLSNTLALTFALEKADIDFDLMLYPGPAARHDIADARLNRHLAGVIWEFVRKNL